METIILTLLLGASLLGVAGYFYRITKKPSAEKCDETCCDSCPSCSEEGHKSEKLGK